MVAQEDLNAWAFPACFWQGWVRKGRGRQQGERDRAERQGGMSLPARSSSTGGVGNKDMSCRGTGHGAGTCPCRETGHGWGWFLVEEPRMDGEVSPQRRRAWMERCPVEEQGVVDGEVSCGGAGHGGWRGVPVEEQGMDGDSPPQPPGVPHPCILLWPAAKRGEASRSRGLCLGDGLILLLRQSRDGWFGCTMFPRGHQVPLLL